MFLGSSGSGFEFVEEELDALGEGDGLNAEVFDGVGFLFDDDVEAVLDDFLVVEVLPVVELLSDFEGPVVREVNQLGRSAQGVEHDLIDLLSAVHFGAAKFVGFSGGFGHFECVEDRKRDIVDEDGLSSGSAIVGNDVEVVPVVSFGEDLHEEVVIHAVDGGRSENGGVREVFLHGLFSMPLSLEIGRRRVLFSAGSRKVD